MVTNAVPVPCPLAARMSDTSLRLDLSRDAQDAQRLRARLRVSRQDWIGCAASVDFVLRVVVSRSGGIDRESSLGRVDLRLHAAEVEFMPPAAVAAAYSHRGSDIDCRIEARVRIDDAVVFDSRRSLVCDLPLARTAVEADAPRQVDPPDQFRLRDNLRAIAPWRRAVVYLLLALGALMAGANALIGMHDQFVPDGAVLLYDHVGSKGKSESPLLKALLGSGGMGLGAWLAIRAQLRRYMRLSLRPGTRLPRRGERLHLQDILRGSARVPLDDFRVRVVAWNEECGQYRERDSKNRQTTRSFRTPCRAVVLYDRRIDFLPAGAPVERYVAGELDLERLYSALLPPLLAGPSHGINLRWEVQLLHPTLIDQELEGPGEGLVAADFLR